MMLLSAVSSVDVYAGPGVYVYGVGATRSSGASGSSSSSTVSMLACRSSPANVGVDSDRYVGASGIVRSGASGTEMSVMSGATGLEP
jgi:hypothetical protein